MAHAVPLVDEVEVRIDMHDMERRLSLEGRDARNVDRMIAPQDHRQRTGCEYFAHPVFDIVMALLGIGMDDVGVADIDHADLVRRHVYHVVLEIVGAAVAEGEQGRCLANRTGSEARARAPLGAAIERRADDGDVGVDGVPVEADGRLAKSADAHEGQVQATLVVTVLFGAVAHCASSVLRKYSRHANIS